MSVSDRSPAEAREDDLRSALSVWTTLALDSGFPGPVTDSDIMALRDWVDGGCVGDLPEPAGTPPVTLADRTKVSIQVFMETKQWSREKFRAALVEARLR
jgi:hypothetical protein